MMTYPHSGKAPWARRIGRYMNARYPKATRATVAVSKWLLIGGIFALFAFIAITLLAEFGRNGWTGPVIGAFLIAMAITSFEWIVSWPGYVWLALVMILQLSGIGSQLGRLNYNVQVLSQTVAAANEGRGERSEFDDDDEL
jgi:hypothetical protein